MLLHRGVIEDNNDPEKLGRLKVRIFGLHTPKNENAGEDFNFIKTDDLPWAELMGSTENSLNNGIGLTSIPRNGTWVWCILDHNNPNKPIVIGTIIGKTTNKTLYSNGQGFNDPDELYPFEARTNESDINRLVRNEKLTDTYYDKNIPNSDYSAGDTTPFNIIKSNLDKVEGVTDSVTGADVSQTEPDPLNDKSEYPNVTINETPSGHVIETDDTEGNERIRVYHKTGSYIEIRPDGSFIQKTVDNSNGKDAISHFIHLTEINEHIKKTVKRYLEDDLQEIIKGNVLKSIDKNLKEHVKGAITITSDGNLEIKNDVLITGNLKVTKKIGSNSDITCAGDLSDNIGVLSQLRDKYDAHFHIGNLGIPTATPIETDPRSPLSPVDVTIMEK